MGWNWAFWVAQRIHTHQVLLGCGLPPSRLLEDAAPAPALADGPALLPYCGNLTVIALSPEEPGRTRDLAAGQLRRVGFE
eukprot:7395098-Lingulodinium_polyedra.AAC.1